MYHPIISHHEFKIPNSWGVYVIRNSTKCGVYISPHIFPSKLEGIHVRIISSLWSVDTKRNSKEYRMLIYGIFIDLYVNTYKMGK